jgi:hypothetical protein
MNEQELRQLYDRYTPNVPFEQFVQDMQDPEYRSEFLRYTMSQMVGRSDQGVKQDPNLGPQPFKMQVPSIIQQAKPSPDQQPAPESVYDNLGLSPDRQEYVTREEDEAQKPQQPPLIGARPQETPFLSPLQIEQKYEKPPVKENIDFATSTSSPFVLNSELKRLKTSPISEDPTPAVGIAKKVIDLENLYARSVKEKTAILKYKYNNFIQDRWNEYSGSIQSEADKQKIENLIKKEAEFFLRNEQAKLEAEVQPFYDAYTEVYNSDMNQMAMKNPTMANAYFRERSMAYSQMGTGERTLRNLLALPALSSAQSVLADVIPGMWASAMAISDNGTYEDAIANKYMRENRLNYGMARQRMAPGQKMQDPKQWQAQIANTAVREEIDRVGQEQFNLDKKEFEKAQSARRAMRLEYAAEQEGEAAGKMASFAPSWKESSGILGISEYIQRQIGQAAAFAVPTVAVSATGAGAPAAFVAGAAMMYGVEAGSSYSESINALRDKYPKLSTQEILQQNLDEPYRDAAVRTGVINAALEQVSNLTMIGKFIPKSSIVKFIDKFVNSRTGKITIGSTVEGTTEWVQKKDQRYQQYLADGMSHHDALEKALEQDDSEEFIAGAVGGGGVSTIASFFNSKKKAMADAITSKISTGDPELDKQIDDEARDAQLINPPKGDLPTQPTPVEQPTVTPTQYIENRDSS